MKDFYQNSNPFCSMQCYDLFNMSDLRGLLVFCNLNLHLSQINMQYVINYILAMSAFKEFTVLQNTYQHKTLLP